MTTALPLDLEVEGVGAPPRANGELIFAEPWESRIFGITMSLYQDGCFTWAAFQAELIAAISRWEASPTDEPFRYYACWLGALEDLLARLDLIDSADLRTRIAQQLARPAGHDHDHDHPGE